MRNTLLVLRGGFALFLMTFIIYFAAVLEGAHPASSISPGSFLLVGGGLFGLVFTAYGVLPFRQVLQTLKGETVDCWELSASLKLVSITAPLLGVIGALLGYIHVMENLEDPSKLGAGVAVAFLTLLYGAFFGIFAYALSGLVKKVQKERTESQEPMNASVESSAELSEPTINPSAPVNETKGEPASVLRMISGLFMFVFCVLLGQALEGGHASSLAFLGAFLIVGGATFSGAIAIHGFSEPWRQFVSVFSAKDAGTKDVSSIRGALNFIVYASPLIGLIGVILGFIHVMQNLSDPSKIGVGIALSLVSMVYGIALSVIAYALLAMIDQATADRRQPARRLPSSESGLFGMTGLFIVLGLFFVIMYAISDVDNRENKEKQTQKEALQEQAVAKAEAQEKTEKKILVSWAFEKSENSKGFPESKVYLKFENFEYEGNKRVFLAKESAWPMNQEVDPKVNLKCSLWHAGAGAEFWVQIENSNLVVYRLYVEETSPEAKKEGRADPKPEKLMSIPIPSDRQVRFARPER